MLLKSKVQETKYWDPDIAVNALGIMSQINHLVEKQLDEIPFPIKKTSRDIIMTITSHSWHIK